MGVYENHWNEWCAMQVVTTAVDKGENRDERGLPLLTSRECDGIGGLEYKELQCMTDADSAECSTREARCIFPSSFSTRAFNSNRAGRCYMLFLLIRKKLYGAIKVMRRDNLYLIDCVLKRILITALSAQSSAL